MSRFNLKQTVKTEKNLQGGIGIKFDDELQLISLLSDGLKGNFYEEEDEREKRIIDLITKIGNKNPEFVAKALVYARSVMGQRSVTHVGAVAAAKVLSGKSIASRFFSKRDKNVNKGGIIYRLDDMLEIVSYYKLRNPNKPLPNALKKGFKSVLENSDEYEIAKNQSKTKEFSLVDLVNMVHPKPSEKMQDVFKKLMKGELKQFNTAEDKQSKAGQTVSAMVNSGELSKEDGKKLLEELKSDNWSELINTNKIGYLALLRNLRNIVFETNDATFDKAMSLLTDENRIRKSLVFPHQIDLALTVLLNEDSLPHLRNIKLLESVNTAYELSIPNLAELFTNGTTAVVVDTSGSMTQNISLGGKSMTDRAIDKGALIGATLCKGIGADLYHFSDDCHKIKYNPNDSINTIKNLIFSKMETRNTYFNTIFRKFNKKYDRVFIISDMQGGDSIVFHSEYQNYINKHGQPFIYSINLCGYNSTMFKRNNKLINLFGYSSDIYEMVRKSEINPNQIIKEIMGIEI